MLFNYYTKKHAYVCKIYVKFQVIMLSTCDNKYILTIKEHIQLKQFFHLKSQLCSGPSLCI